MVWGISGESKYNKLNCSFDFANMDFSAFRFGGNCQLGDYFDCLESGDYEGIHILGFSDENDDHINSRIRLNKNINKVIYYTDPTKVDNKDEIVRIRILFQGANQQLKILSWNELK
jgi:hypothetical protein